MAKLSRLLSSRWAGLAAASLLCWIYARGGAAWVLGFVALVPWLRALDAGRSLRRSLLSGWLMSVGYTAAVFYWFGSALGAYTQIGAGWGLALLLLAAPLFQPQILVFALVRSLARRRLPPVGAALAAAAAWVAAEWALPHALGDSFGHGLYPSALLRQGAAVGGVAGLTLLLLLANEAVNAALGRWREGARAVAIPLAAAAAVPLLLAGYGGVSLQPEPATTAPPLRVALVQSNIHDYERLRREKGAGAVVREVLDTHYAMTYDAVERQHAQAVLWSETVYPTTFGHAKSEAGAELDREIQSIVNAAGVPFVFGTYDVDAEGEYNAAAFVAPGTGLVGMYRKTRLFPFTEALPAWLDGPTVRGWLPGAGTWRPGTGARVFPLRLRDGREIPVLPLICLDDTDASLGIDGARLGAQAILTMSNDAWFTAYPQGAELHQTVAAFRSIETRLPQFRVTTNGFSAVIDATGAVIASSRMGERTLVIGDVPVRDPARTLVMAWGDWVGRAAAALLALLGVWVALRRWVGPAASADTQTVAMRLPAGVVVMPRWARGVAGLLRVVSRGSLLVMIGAILLGDGALQSNTLAQIRSFAGFFLLPELAAWCVLRAFAAQVALLDGQLVLTRGRQQMSLALADVAAIEPWGLPIPGAGASLRLRSGALWPYQLAVPQPLALAQALGLPAEPVATLAVRYARARSTVHPSRLDQPWAKFVLFPLLLAIPAFRLHQHIAYGSSFGEYFSFGLVAYLGAFALWWAAWAIGVVLCAAALRTVIEAGTVLGALLQPARSAASRVWLERLGLAALYLGLPVWLAWRALAS
jgi:apolipoprotein N-acyltransferase